MQQEGMDKKTTSMKSVNFAGLENPQQLTLAKLGVVAANCGLFGRVERRVGIQRGWG